MARRAVDPSARIVRLQAARDLLKAGDVLNLEEMATAAGITSRHLKPMIDEDPDFPVIQRGSEGVAWQFDAFKVIAHMIARAEQTLAERRARIERLQDLAGIVVPEVPMDLSLPEIRELDRLQTAAQRRKIEQGNYVPKADFQAVVGDLLAFFQRETLGLISRIDAEGKLPAAIREAVEEDLRDMLVRTHDSVAKHLSADAG